MPNANRVWTKEEIVHLVMTNRIMLERSILKIYSNQTRDEQDVRNTKHHNSIGFNGLDAQFLSSLAEQIQKSQYPEGRRLSPKQTEYAKRKMVKYAKQLLTFCEN